MKQFFLGFILCCSVFSCQLKQGDQVSITDKVTGVDSLPPAVQPEPAKLFTDYNSMIRLVPELEKSAAYDDSYFEHHADEERNKAAVTRCIAPDSIPCDDKAYFVWKIVYLRFVVFDVITTSWNAKGQSIIHNLLSVNDDGELVDCRIGWAAQYAVSVDNLNGGTSAGIETVNGSVEFDPVITYRSSRQDGSYTVYELSPDGHFVAPYSQFEAETSGDLRGEGD